MTDQPTRVAVPVIVFARLTEVPVDDVTKLLNESRNARHMPLARHFSEDEVAAWVRAKDAQWDEHGYGPWAIFIDGDFAGWGGFQHESNGADYALVLSPEHWGVGSDVTRRAFQIGFNEMGLEEILIALPLSRNPDRVVAKLGFRPDETVTYDGTQFRQYRLNRRDAAQLDPAIAFPARPDAAGGSRLAGADE